MEQAPGVRPQIDIGGDSMTNPPVFRAFGQDNQPWQQIEGVLVSAAKNTAQGGIYWDYNMVEEAKVGTFGSAAEIGTRGIAINGIMKSGRQCLPRHRVLRRAERMAPEQQHR